MSLTLDQARARSRVVSDVAYAVHLDLSEDDAFTATTTVTFTAVPGETTFLDLQHARAVEVELNGAPVDPAYRDDQLHLEGLQERNTAVVTARMPYVTDGDGLHRFVDPADGAVYLGCYGGMDVTRRVLACFDQPDLKATFALSVTARAGATVLANGTATSPSTQAGGTAYPGDGHGEHPATWTFSTTPPIATYLFTVCAGPWVSRTWEHAGTTFGWHARAAAADDLDRDLPDLRSATEAAFDHYAARFTEPYPFGAYDQVFVPGHNWGAMETPGCVTYRDELLPRGTTDAGLRRRRAMTIAHEMAHMWFGNLVTFRWWEDTWLNESFADYLGFLVTEATGTAPGALAEFDLSRKAGGYAADDRPSTHPVAPRPEDVPDVDSAFNNFDAISYAKGNACLRQLAFWLGEEIFFAGVDRHLSSARFGTADLGDLVSSLQSVTDRDVHAWVAAWLRSSGTDELRVARTAEGTGLTLAGSRPHRLRVTGYAVAPAGLTRAFEEVVDLEPGAGAEAALPAADVVVANSTGDTFVRVAPEGEVRDALLEHVGSVPDDHARTIAWATLLDQAGRGELPVDRLVEAVERHLPGEADGVVVDHVLGRGVQVVRSVSGAAQVAALAERLAVVGLDVLGRAGGGHGDGSAEGHAGSAVAVVEAATRTVLLTTHDADLLRAWLDAGPATGALSQAHRWGALARLAELGEDVEEELAAEQRRDPSEVGRLAVLTARAAAPTARAKAQALDQMAGDAVTNREITALAAGLWSAEQREVVDPAVAAYLDRMAAVARRGQAIALVVGRAAPALRWTDEQLAALEEALADPTLPPVLARTWADVLHDQRRLAANR